MKTFCITCRELTTRTDEARKEFAKHDLEVDFWYGFFGTTLGVTSTLRKPPHLLHSNAYALTLNHLALWEACRHFDDDEFLIFEDDVRLCNNFKDEFQKSYEALPEDWEVVYVGALAWENHPKKVINDRVAIIEYPLATHAMLYKKSVLDTLIAQNSKLETLIDMQMRSYSLPYLHHYMFLPNLAFQKKDTKNWRSSITQLPPKMRMPNDPFFTPSSSNSGANA